MPHWSLEIKIRIVDRAETGWTHQQISETLGVPLSTVSQIIRDYHNRGTVERKKGSGRPKKMDERSKRRLLRIVEKNPEATLAELQAQMPIKCSTWLISKHLHESNLNKRVAVVKPYLTEKQRKARYKFAKEHLNWTVDQWKRVIWTDESSFQIGANVIKKKVWRRRSEKYKKSCIKASFKSGRTSVMVWGAICGGRKSPLVVMPKNKRTSQDFVNIVYEPALLDFYQSIPNAILMEDNAPIHRAKTAENWRLAHGIVKMEWPAQSPDLNPIENLWYIMKKHFHKKWAHRRSSIATEALLEFVWIKIEKSYIDKLVESMPKRMQLLVDAEGDPIKY